MMNDNVLPLVPYLCTDVYKVGHCSMYPHEMDTLYTNATPRSDSYFKGSKYYDHTSIYMGMQGLWQVIVKDWHINFFSVPRGSWLRIYRKHVAKIMGIPRSEVYTKHLEDLYELGYLPLEIRQLPEGSSVPFKVPVMTVYNTVAGFGWLVNYFETIISAGLWRSCVAATIAREYRRVFEYYQKLTDGAEWFVDYQGHDFSYRGLSPFDAMYTSGGHLSVFKGTDTIPGILMLDTLYGTDDDDYVIGSSVMASEHSVACANIEANKVKNPKLNTYEAERDFLRRYITEIVPKGIASYVSDTFDFFAVISRMAEELKAEIMGRDGKTVFRPDSGCPVKILTGYRTLVIDDTMSSRDVISADGTVIYNQAIAKRFDEYHEDGTLLYEAISIKVHGVRRNFEVVKDDTGMWCVGRELDKYELNGAVRTLWDIFGGTTNSKGYRTLDQHVGLIYGDSITIERAELILSRLAELRFASDNVVMGIGSFTYQYVTRDTLGYALKATAMRMKDNIDWVSLQKQPKTDTGLKRSAKGRLIVTGENGNYKLLDGMTDEEYEQNLHLDQMQLLFRDGQFDNLITVEELRERVAQSL